jgi:hypothetical protein
MLLSFASFKAWSGRRLPEHPPSPVMRKRVRPLPVVVVADRLLRSGEYNIRCTYDLEKWECVC